MLRKTIVALAAVVVLCTALVSTEASARYEGYGRGSGPSGIWYGNYGYPNVPCRTYYYSGTYTYAGWFPYAGCDPSKQ